MKPIKLCTALATALLLSLPLVAFAQDAEEETPLINWSLAATSDYVWRGSSQSDENPTGQAGLTFNIPGGFYAGAWASGVDFGGNKPDFEVDYFVGYNVDFSDSVNFDVMVNRYTYPDAAELNFAELITKTTFAENYSLTVAYTDDFGGTDASGLYFAGGASFGLPNDYSIDLSLGRNTFDDEVGYEDYTDWSVGVSKSWGMVSASLGYYGTDGNGRDNFGELADNRVVLTLSVGN
jgi:uncharacterized protein (TIGR02001 family)